MIKAIVSTVFTLIFCLPLHSQKTTVSYQTYNGFDDPIVKAKLDTAIAILQEVVNDPAFEKAFFDTRFIRRKRKSKLEIFNLIKRGQEDDGSLPDNVINLKLMVYNNEKNEVGHTDGGDTIHTHKGYILANPAVCYAAHLLHEYCHVLGFTHAFLRMPLRFMTVPYRAGRIVARMKGCYCP